MPRGILDAEPPYVYTTERPSILDFMAGVGGREISVGPRIWAQASDASDRSLLASTTIAISINLNQIDGTQWPGFGSDQGIVVEKLYGGILFQDASAQIQVLSLGLNSFLTPSRINPSLPFTAPALAGAGLWTTLMHPMVCLRKTEDVIVNSGPALQITLKNLDGSLPHPYRLRIGCIVRAISNVYTDGHVSYPG